MAGQSAAISLAVQPAFSNTTALLSPVTASVAATSLGTTRRLRLRLSFSVSPFDHCDLLTSARTSSAATLSAVQPAFNNPIALLPAAAASTSATLCTFFAQLFVPSAPAAVPAYFLTTALTTQPDSQPSFRYHSRTSVRLRLLGDYWCH